MMAVAKDTKKVAYMTDSECTFRGVWHRRGDIIMLDEGDVPKHAKLVRIEKVPESYSGKIYDPTGDAGKAFDIGKALSGILK